jgi:hypothetical protein
MTPDPRLTIIWPDNTIIQAETWGELERAIRAVQWRTYSTRFAFRRVLSRRARVWSGYAINREVRRGPAKAYILALAEADMFMLIDAHQSAAGGTQS